jgi:hypothetical protein
MDRKKSVLQELEREREGNEQQIPIKPEKQEMEQSSNVTLEAMAIECNQLIKCRVQCDDDKQKTECTNEQMSTNGLSCSVVTE